MGRAGSLCIDLMTKSIPAVGTLAPDFTLQSSARADVTLSGFRGRNVLLAFFPLAFTGVCTAELCEMRDDWEQFQVKDTVVLPAVPVRLLGAPGALPVPLGVPLTSVDHGP